MGRLERGLVGVAGIASASLILVLAAATGCATGDSAGLDPVESATADPDAGTTPGRVRPGPGSTDDPSVKPDAGTDSGAPVGSKCPTLGETRSKPCGTCGKAVSRCVDDGSGNRKWSDYGACEDEVVGGCVPGTVVSEGCGECGTRNKTCSASCTFTAGTCNEPPTCTTTPGVVNVPASVNGTASQVFTLSATKVGSRFFSSDSCPVTRVQEGSYPYEHIEVKNTTGSAATVTIYVSQAPGGNPIDTMMVGYQGATKPTDPTSLKACSFGVNDDSESYVSLTGNVLFSVLPSVPIAAGASVVVYIVSRSPSSEGALKINVRRDS